ncbi:uncharacterized protein LOC114769478 [Denticeps clupeoides]|uniref:uncharacterized protein LOC114769478 n=1 Tax=Denticeps clupeoides TaxID=299321 RepID=UPI0010A3A8A0|nr:uncharacterized protein LOC114769478 [Denticeps clupeoides]
MAGCVCGEGRRGHGEGHARDGIGLRRWSGALPCRAADARLCVVPLSRDSSLPPSSPPPLSLSLSHGLSFSISVCCGPSLAGAPGHSCLDLLRMLLRLTRRLAPASRTLALFSFPALFTPAFSSTLSLSLSLVSSLVPCLPGKGGRTRRRGTQKDSTPGIQDGKSLPGMEGRLEEGGISAVWGLETAGKQILHRHAGARNAAPNQPQPAALKIVIRLTELQGEERDGRMEEEEEEEEEEEADEKACSLQHGASIKV